MKDTVPHHSNAARFATVARFRSNRTVRFDVFLCTRYVLMIPGNLSLDSAARSRRNSPSQATCDVPIAHATRFVLLDEGCVGRVCFVLTLSVYPLSLSFRSQNRRAGPSLTTTPRLTTAVLGGCGFFSVRLF